MSDALVIDCTDQPDQPPPLLPFVIPPGLPYVALLRMADGWVLHADRVTGLDLILALVAGLKAAETDEH